MAWEGMSGFYTTLYEIASTRTLQLEARMMAVMFFKNRIEKYWRKDTDRCVQGRTFEMIQLAILITTVMQLNRVQ